MDNSHIAGAGSAGGDRIVHHGGIHAGGDLRADRGGSIAGGDMVVSHTGDTRSEIEELRHEIERLGDAIADLRLSRSEHKAAENDLEALRDLAASEDPSHEQAAAGNHLQRLVKVLTAAGAIADAGNKLADPITRIGQLLGSAGSSVLTLLP